MVLWSTESIWWPQSCPDLLRCRPHYNPQKLTTIASDASAHGIGAVLSQLQPDGTQQPVSFACCSLRKIEKRYAVTEHEAPATPWVCDCFIYYLLALPFNFQTDYKPLLLSTDLDCLSSRILCFHLRMMRYCPSRVIHVADKNNVTSGSLSWAPVEKSEAADSALSSVVEHQAISTVEHVSASNECLRKIKEAQNTDKETAQIMQYCESGWLRYPYHSPAFQPYFQQQEHFSVVNGILLHENHLVISKSQRMEILAQIHGATWGLPSAKHISKQLFGGHTWKVL